MLSIKYFTVTLAIKHEFYQIIEFYCCSTSKINPSWNKLYWYSTLKSQILMIKQILQFPWLDLIFIKTFFWVKKIMSNRQVFFVNQKSKYITTQTYFSLIFVNIKYICLNLLLLGYFCTSAGGKCTDSIFSSSNLLNWKYWKDFLKSS